MSSIIRSPSTSSLASHPPTQPGGLPKDDLKQTTSAVRPESPNAGRAGISSHPQEGTPKPSTAASSQAQQVTQIYDKETLDQQVKALSREVDTVIKNSSQITYSDKEGGNPIAFPLHEIMSKIRSLANTFEVTVNEHTSTVVDKEIRVQNLIRSAIDNLEKTTKKREEETLDLVSKAIVNQQKKIETVQARQTALDAQHQDIIQQHDKFSNRLLNYSDRQKETATQILQAMETLKKEHFQLRQTVESSNTLWEEQEQDREQISLQLGQNLEILNRQFSASKTAMAAQHTQVDKLSSQVDGLEQQALRSVSLTQTRQTYIDATLVAHGRNIEDIRTNYHNLSDRLREDQTNRESMLGIIRQQHNSWADQLKSIRKDLDSTDQRQLESSQSQASKITDLELQVKELRNQLKEALSQKETDKLKQEQTYLQRELELGARMEKIETMQKAINDRQEKKAQHPRPKFLTGAKTSGDPLGTPSFFSSHAAKRS